MRPLKDLPFRSWPLGGVRRISRNMRENSMTIHPLWRFCAFSLVSSSRMKQKSLQQSDRVFAARLTRLDHTGAAD